MMALAGVALVAGCAAQPMTRERAARLCADEARAADGISGSIGVGAGSEGGSAAGRLVITSAILDPQSEADGKTRMAGGGESGLTLSIEGATPNHIRTTLLAQSSPSQILPLEPEGDQ
jgi:hypothetical protein